MIISLIHVLTEVRFEILQKHMRRHSKGYGPFSEISSSSLHTVKANSKTATRLRGCPDSPKASGAVRLRNIFFT